MIQFLKWICPGRWSQEGRWIALPAAVGLSLLGVLGFPQSESGRGPLPPPVNYPVNFQRDVKPILQRACYACHAGSTEMNGFSLAYREAALRGGYSGQKAILPGNSASSRLIHLVSGLDPELRMPPAGDPLTADEIAILRAWIDQGASFGVEKKERQPAVAPWLGMDYGPFLSASISVKKPEDPRADKKPGENITYKGISVSLGPEKQAHILFDTELLRYSVGWLGKGLALEGTVYDGAHGPHPYLLGSPVFQNPVAPGWSTDGSLDDPRPVPYGPLPRQRGRYKGVYLHGDSVLFAYTIAGTEILDLPGYQEEEGLKIFTRTLELAPSRETLVLNVCREPESKVRSYPLGAGLPEGLLLVGPAGGGLAVAAAPSRWLQWDSDSQEAVQLVVAPRDHPLRVRLFLASLDPEQWDAFAAQVRSGAPPTSFRKWKLGGPSRYPEVLTTRGELASESSAYVVDHLPLPDENPWNSWMRIGGFDFFSDDRAALCTWSGDVWVVSGIDSDLDELRWRRYATGLFQPLGLKIVEDVIYVLGRDQITRLQDLNGDGEADFYENFNNDVHITHHFHEFAFDLQLGPDGDFYFAKAARHALPAVTRHHGTILRVSRDGEELEILSTGFRAQNGLSVGPLGQMTTSDNQGHWVPATRIDWCRKGSYHGYRWGGSIPDRPDYDPPICWVPVQIDNSGATQVWVTSDRWGPLQGSLLHTSYGKGALFQVLMEEVEGRIQGGVLRLPLPFDTGIMRARFRPQDGQLYVAGLSGWNTEKTAPGGFYRIRYTGKPICLPLELHATRKGILLRFSSPLDAETALRRENYFAKRWNYRWSARYGSPLYQLNGQEGTETLQIRQVDLLEEGTALFLHIADLQPVMQMQLGYTLRAADGTPLNHEIYHTIHALGPTPGKTLDAWNWLGSGTGKGR